MKHSGSCICGQYKFETELDPMLIIQCNCTKCRKLSGSYQIGCLYSVSEIEETGQTASYSFEGGSEPPHFYWSMFMFRKRRTTNGKQASEAGGYYHEVAAS